MNEERSHHESYRKRLEALCETIIQLARAVPENATTVQCQHCEEEVPVSGWLHAGDISHCQKCGGDTVIDLFRPGERTRLYAAKASQDAGTRPESDDLDKDGRGADETEIAAERPATPLWRCGMCMEQKLSPSLPSGWMYFSPGFGDEQMICKTCMTHLLDGTKLGKAIKDAKSRKGI